MIVGLLCLLFGMVAGFALGLTGGGGSIFAVPMLVYGIGVPPHEAVGISLAAVGAIAAVGFVQRWRQGEVEVGTGVLFSATGMLGAPVGAWLNSLLPAAVLLTAFAVLMVFIAVRMWRKATTSPAETHAVRARWDSGASDENGPVCRRDPQGRLKLTSQCAALLALLGLVTGVLSGLFGVGGGFVILPALVLFSGMGIHRAVATSLMIITLISAAGISSYVLAGRPIDGELTALFAGGGVLGMLGGTLVSRRLTGPALQNGFSVAIVLVAIFVLLKTLL